MLRSTVAMTKTLVQASDYMLVAIIPRANRRQAGISREYSHISPTLDYPE